MARIPFTLIAFLTFALSNPTLAQPGTFDLNFSGNGYTTLDIGEYGDYTKGMVVQPDGKVVVIGEAEGVSFDGDQGLVARYLTDGNLDPTFSDDGLLLFTDFFPRDVILQPDGRIVLVGSSSVGIAVVRLTQYGSPDNDFSFDGRVTLVVGNGAYGAAVALYPDGRILAAGTSYDEVFDTQVTAVRFQADGSVDLSFSLDGAVAVDVASDNESVVSAAAIDSDGGVILAGSIEVDMEGFHPVLLRFTPDGTLDPGFGTNGVVVEDLNSDMYDNTFISDMVMDADGRFLLVGTDGYSVGFLIRYLANGSRDTDFSFDGAVLVAPGGESCQLGDVALQPDGKILASGYGNGGSILVRFTGAGALDLSFNGVGYASNNFAPNYTSYSELALAPDGKIIVAGDRDNGDYRVIFLGRFLNDLNIGIAEFTTVGNTLVYPNPVGAETTFGCTLAGAEKITCELLDAEGRTVRTYLSSTHRPAGTHSETLDLSGLAAGRYTIILRNATGFTATSIIKN